MHAVYSWVVLLSLQLALAAEAGFGHRKLGCLLAPSICIPPEGCADDGLIGSCRVSFTNSDWRAVQREKQLAIMLENLKRREYDINYNYQLIGKESQDASRIAMLLSELYWNREKISPPLEVEKASEKDHEYRRWVSNAEMFPVKSHVIDTEKSKKMVRLINEARYELESKNIRFADLSKEETDQLVEILAKMLMKDDMHRKLDADNQKLGMQSVSNKSREKSPKPYANENQQNLKLQEIPAAMNEGAEGVSVVKDFQTITQYAKDPVKKPDVVKHEYEVADQLKIGDRNKTLYTIIIVVGATVLLIILVTVVTCCLRTYWYRKGANEKFVDGISSGTEKPLGDDYQELCRQHYASKNSEQTEDHKTVIPDSQSAVKVPMVTNTYPVLKPSDADPAVAPDQARGRATHTTTRTSSLSSTSWSEEPVTASLDITTGHAVLTYMEDHLNNKCRLDKEWEDICGYETDRTTVAAATDPQNTRKNRSVAALPYDHNRVKLDSGKNHLQSDYINASKVIDNDPKRSLYIAAQGPLASTIPDFWQMMWEQGCVAIVMLAPLVEEGVHQCARYWPDEGSCTYHNFEIHLVSEHIWCEDYLVRSLYLKNLESGETRTVTQFHFLSWPNNRIPSTPKPLLELRRKVTKCYKGHNSPVLVHCSDGVGRTGTYILLDLAIDRMLKGAKEINIAATLEHIRDQRAGMVSTKEQFEFALMAVAEEVNAILKSLLH